MGDSLGWSGGDPTQATPFGFDGVALARLAAAADEEGAARQAALLAVPGLGDWCEIRVHGAVAGQSVLATAMAHDPIGAAIATPEGAAAPPAEAAGADRHSAEVEIGLRGMALGSVRVARASRPYARAEREVVEQFAAWLALILDRFRLVAAQRALVQEHARRDDALQAETRARLQAEAAMRDQRCDETDAQRTLHRYEEVLRGISDGVMAADAQGKLVYANDNIAWSLGFSSALELLALSCHEIALRTQLYDEDGRALPLADYPTARSLRGEPTLGRVLRFVGRGAGQDRWLVVQSRPVCNADGQVSLAITTLHDVTELKRAEARLRRASDEREAILRNIADAVVVTDALGDVVFANDTALRLIGADPSQGGGEIIRGFGALYSASDEAGRKLAWTELPMVLGSAGIATAGRTLRIRPLRTGNERVIVVNATPVLDASGRVEFVVNTAHDITERKRWEEEQRRREAELRLITDTVPVLIAFVDRGLRCRFANRVCEEWLGHPRAELLDRPLADVLGPEAWNAVRAQVNVALEGESATVERPLPFRAGSRYVQVTCVPRRAQQDGFDGLVVLATDLSDRRRADEALQRSEEQLRHSQKMEAIGRLAGGVAHDFNNLLTAINGYSELTLAMMNPHDACFPHVEQIRKAGDRAASLTRQLLAFSRKQIVAPKILDLNGVVADLEKMLRRLIGENIELRTHLRANRALVRMDPGQVEQIVMNLALNARDAMPRGGTLTIETSEAVVDLEGAQGFIDAEPGPYVMLTVSDNGCGISTEVMAHLFEPFFSTKAPGKGTGLGLSTVYGIVQHARGGLRVTSEPSRGTEFQVLLPQVSSSGAAASVRAARKDRGLPRGTESVLVVEDEDAVRLLVGRILRGLGYTVLEASSGEAALHLLHSEDPSIQLLLTDVVMSGMNGRELAEAVVAMRPGTQVLYMSGYTDDAILQLGLLESTATLINKPFTPAEIAQRLRQVLKARV